MSLLKQAKPTFNSIQELREYISRKEESLYFWATMRTVDTSEILRELKKDIMDAKKLLAEWVLKEKVAIR